MKLLTVWTAKENTPPSKWKEETEIQRVEIRQNVSFHQVRQQVAWTPGLGCMYSDVAWKKIQTPETGTQTDMVRKINGKYKSHKIHFVNIKNGETATDHNTIGITLAEEFAFNSSTNHYTPEFQ